MGSVGPSISPNRLSLAGCGKTMPPLLKSNSRARQAGRARRAKRGGNPICPRRAFLACLARHGSTGSPSRAKSRDAAQSVAAGGLFQHPASPHYFMTVRSESVRTHGKTGTRKREALRHTRAVCRRAERRDCPSQSRIRACSRNVMNNAG